MNNQSPLIPQGSLLEQRNKGRARVKIAVFLVLAIHGVGLMALLMQGCKKEPDTGTTTASTAADTNSPAPTFVEPTNTPVADTNVAAASANTAPPAVVESPATTAPTTAPASDYVIAKGDTFSTVAHKFHVSLKALMEANPSVEPTKLKIGQSIHIPAVTASTTAPTSGAGGTTAADTNGTGQTYSVKSGDSLTKIAGQFGVTVRAIRSANSLKTDKNSRFPLKLPPRRRRRRPQRLRQRRQGNKQGCAAAVTAVFGAARVSVGFARGRGDGAFRR